MVEAEVLIRPEDAAHRLALSRAMIYKLLASGELPCVTIGRSRRVRLADLERFVKTRQKLAGRK